VFASARSPRPFARTFDGKLPSPKGFAMRYAYIAFPLLLSSVTPAVAQLSINFSQPGVSIGVNFGSYPTMQRVPGYPVYYAPQLQSNYFFYDGMYWVYEGDNWYSSSWYNGPWWAVDPYNVPPYVLRVPVRYYGHAPEYFHGWNSNNAPRWGDHWGQSWQQKRSGWDQWNRASAPTPAPLPSYQRQYSGNRYPNQIEQQAAIVTQHYKYQPKDPVAKQHFQHQRSVAQSAQREQPKPQASRQQQPAPKPHYQQSQSQPQYQGQGQSHPQAQPQPVQQPAQRQQGPKDKPEQAQVERKPPKEAVAQGPRDEHATPPQGQQHTAPPSKEHSTGKGHEKDDDKDNDKDNPGKGKGH